MTARRYPHEYFVWRAMIGRCTKPHYPRYQRYGGRGISICERWACSYANFIADMGHRPSPQHSIDRVDNDGNYEPLNCRWATPAEQAHNTSRNVLNWHLVAVIRRLHDVGMSQRKIATKIGVGRGAVRNVVDGTSWGGVAFVAHGVDDVIRELARETI